LPNWREAIVAFYGLAMGGFVLVPIVHIYGHKEGRFILRQSGARAYISADRFGSVDYVLIVDGAAPGELTGLPCHIVVGDAPTASNGIRRTSWSTVDQATPTDCIAKVNADDVCVLAYTSGTTSEPKGVMHTHRTLLAELTHMRLFISADAPMLMGS